MYTIKPLKYNYNYFEPYISSRTIDIHYNKHYKKYLDKLNNLLIKNNYDFKYSKEELVNHIDIFPLSDRDDILFNLGGVINHELYFENLGYDNKPNGLLEQKINKQYGSFFKFKEEFIKVANELVGSGYTFLIINKNKDLEIINVSNQDTPYSYGVIPIMNIDLWEHAYYLDYQNDKNKYIENFFSIVDFGNISKKYEKEIQ
ncbi:MAG: superoxide dismutase [Firmicutes bacterium]|nr:superoxide dismutase [Bacillota bacterium]